MINPDEVAAAARHISAKMVADQAIPLMVSLVGMRGDPEDPEPTERAAVIVVARGAGATRILDWLDKSCDGKTSSVEVEPYSDDLGQHAENCQLPEVPMNTVGDDYPVQQARVRRIQQYARDLGPGGQYLVVLTEMALKEAEEAAISSDIVRILRAYQQLKEFKE